MANPAAKRKRLTAAEKEAKDKEAADRKKEREEKAAIKAVEKAKAEEEKAARAKEREEKRKKKEEEEREKQREKDEKKRKKEEEQQKKARAQPTLNSFFRNPGTPKKAGADAAIKDESPSKESPAKSKPESRYQAMFKPFFLKEKTRWNKSPIQMDEETREAKSQILDEFISGKREQQSKGTSFDPVEVFALPCKPPKRGRLHHPVKHIMEEVYKEADGSGSTGTDEAAQIIKQARKKLATVPIKVIAFSQDVRPPYYGTVTFKPFALGQGNMRKLARRTMGRRLPLDYDYDSEAEWQDDEGEDLDLEDDEEELEDEDDMDGFLDDSEDAGVARRIFGNTVLEPDSTGICFENSHRAGPNQALSENAMEFMHGKYMPGQEKGHQLTETTGGLEHSWGVDPFSTTYWEPEVKAKPAKPAKAAPSGDKTAKTAKMPPPPTPSNAFAALDGGAAAGARPDKMVKDELLTDVKQAILANKALSKVGIIDFVFQQFRSDASRAEVKNTIEYVAEKKGAGRSKEWALKPGHEIPA